MKICSARFIRDWCPVQTEPSLGLGPDRDPPFGDGCSAGNSTGSDVECVNMDTGHVDRAVRWTLRRAAVLARTGLYQWHRHVPEQLGAVKGGR